MDTTVIESLEYEHFKKKDFYRLDNYVLRLRPEAVKKLLAMLQIKFNSTIHYKGKRYGWDTVIRLKAQQLANHILDKNVELNFDKPNPILSSDESQAVRDRILSLTVAEARKHGITKNTLWYMQQRAARKARPLKMYNKIKSKLL